MNSEVNLQSSLTEICKLGGGRHVLHIHDGINTYGDMIIFGLIN